MNCMAKTLTAAVLYLRDRPLCADPAILLECVQDWVRAFWPLTDQECRELGEIAARECARPTKQIICKLTEL